MSSKDSFLIEDPIDLFYLTGLNLSRGMLFVSKERVCLFVDGRYLEAAQQLTSMDVSFLKESALLKFIKDNQIDEIIFDSAKTSCERLEQLRKSLKTRFKAKPHLVRDLRAIKNRKEIEKLKESARLNYAGFEHIAKQLKVGVSERELSVAYEIFCLKEGAEKPAFEPIIAFGKNSALPHYRAGGARLKKGDVVLFDLGAQLDGYASDMTRVRFFGPANAKLKQFYTVVRDAHQAALTLCKAGVQVGALDRAARAVMASAGVEELFVHSLGHGIGLEVHEFPLIKNSGPDHLFLLKEGMAITIEPGLYLPGTGGIRYEDTLLITENGFLNLYPKDPS